MKYHFLSIGKVLFTLFPLFNSVLFSQQKEPPKLFIECRCEKSYIRQEINFVNHVRHQINLPAGSASLEDVLLQQKQIATDFETGFRVGVSYTFGSAFNNIINTRL